MKRKRGGLTIRKWLTGWPASKVSFYILFGAVYLVIIWVFHIFAPFYHKSNDTWNDRTFSEPLEGELFPGNIILIDIDSWPYYRDNRDEAKQARDKVVNGMIEIIDLLNRDPEKKPPFIGIDMTFESYADNKIMDQLFTRMKNNENIFQAVEFDREKRALTFPRNYFWDKITGDMEKLKKRLMVINLEKYADEPVRRYKPFYKASFDSTGTGFCFPSMGTVVAKMVNRYYFGDPRLEVTDRITRRPGHRERQPGHRVTRFRFRYLIQNIKEDYRKYNVFSMREAVNELGKRDIAKSIVIFGRMDPDPNGRDRFPVCASIKKGNIEREATLPGVMIHINAAQSILLKESIRPMGNWEVLVYLTVLLVVLILFHIYTESFFSKSKSRWSHWYPEIFLFCATVFVIIVLDYILKKPGSRNLEIPMFTFYMFAINFYPAIGIIDWFYRHFLSRWCKQKGNKDLKEELKNENQ